MMILGIANFVAVLIAAWAVWECRLSFRSQWDSPKTTTLIFFALGATLDSPFRALSEASFPLTGKYYLITVVGHLCYLAAAAFGNKYIYLRLLPASAVGRFMRTRMTPPILLAAAVMVVCFVASPVTSSLTADHLYLTRPDPWLAVYWLTFYLTLTAELVVAIYGVYRLRTDPRSVMLNLLLASLSLGVLSCLASGWGLIRGSNDGTQLWAWPVAYAAIVAGSVAVVMSWRLRYQQMLRPPPD